MSIAEVFNPFTPDHTSQGWGSTLDHASAGVTANDYHAYTGLVGHGNLARGQPKDVTMHNGTAWTGGGQVFGGTYDPHYGTGPTPGSGPPRYDENLYATNQASPTQYSPASQASGLHGGPNAHQRGIEKKSRNKLFDAFIAIRNALRKLGGHIPKGKADLLFHVAGIIEEYYKQKEEDKKRAAMAGYEAV
ncbi:hypothetical protein SISSUDRAFT_1047249 [Sistotremastrum suecicum HHB10207 ss-3]|uniref:Uncharacterized protein n=1 Tax=Sistotremastrum suecicum HHB10207 ss-3 TaxID=1314776 RepID=A0A166D9Z9_9AGAM|nr:hypothetical protein SISSUDRAFT_1047249 [Sistotremastrum suecicum HHB10207 ss-3]